MFRLNILTMGKRSSADNVLKEQMNDCVKKLREKNLN